MSTPSKDRERPKERLKEEKRISMRIRKSFSVFLGNPKKDLEGRDGGSPIDKRIFEVDSPKKANPDEFRTIGTEALGYNTLDVQRLSSLSASNKSDGTRSLASTVQNSPFTLEPVPVVRRQSKRRPKSMGPATSDFLRSREQDEDLRDVAKRSSLGLGEVPPQFRVPQSS